MENKALFFIMKKFEYKGIYIKQLTNIDDFNKAGEDGWELVSMIPAYANNGYKGIFKREIVEDANKIPLND